jgi:hypothetical protein
MNATMHAASPFDMLINPQAILEAIEQSSRLQGLERKICRPLDRVAAPKSAPSDEAAAFDAMLERRREAEA